MRDWGTLLQDAVYENKQDFVRILLESGYCTLLFEYQKNLHRVIVKSNIPIFII